MAHARARGLARARHPHPVDDLSFTDRMAPTWDPQRGRCYWAVQSTGTYTLDLKVGDLLADEALAHMDQWHNAHLLADIVRDMAQLPPGADSGLINGFFFRVAEVLLAGGFRPAAAPAAIAHHPASLEA